MTELAKVVVLYEQEKQYVHDHPTEEVRIFLYDDGTLDSERKPFNDDPFQSQEYKSLPTFEICTINSEWPVGIRGDGAIASIKTAFAETCVERMNNMNNADNRPTRSRNA
jgi:hypothetical protein